MLVSVVLLVSVLPSVVASENSSAEMAREYEQVRKIALRDPKVRSAYATADRRLEEKILQIDPVLRGYVSELKAGKTARLSDAGSGRGDVSLGAVGGQSLKGQSEDPSPSAKMKETGIFPFNLFTGRKTTEGMEQGGGEGVKAGAVPTRGKQKDSAEADSQGRQRGGEARHEVIAGETLTSIAALYGVSVGELERANSLNDRHKVRVGQTLKVPGAGSVEASEKRSWDKLWDETVRH